MGNSSAMIGWWEWLILIIISLLILVIALIILQYLILNIRLIFFWKDQSSEELKDIPQVSVLVAARNEELTLPHLLNSFEQLEYSTDHIQFLFADDQSSDRTAEILKEWCEKSQNRFFLTIQPEQSNLFNKNGKANALAILSERAAGMYYFFTDADCEVHPEWISEGVSCFVDKIGLLIGITQVKSMSLLEKFQEIDWWLTLGFVKAATDLGIPTTGLGNNMVISREAYQQSGGFKNLPYCLTEDLEISRAIQREGFRIAHQVSPEMLVKTKPEGNFWKLLDQRKRWMQGVMTLPFYWKVILGLQATYFVGLAYILTFNVVLGLCIGFVKVLLQSLFLAGIGRKAGVKINWLHLLVFDIYNFNTILLTILYYFWPSKTKWKSRIYP